MSKEIPDLTEYGSAPDVDDLLLLYDTSAEVTLKITKANLLSGYALSSSLGTAAAKDYGTSNGNLVELDSVGLPSVDGSQLTGLRQVPVGSLIIWHTSTPPTGYLEEDGSAISRTAYSALFAVIGTTYGVGDGSTTFNIPDSQGYFLRGWNNGAGNDPDAASRTDRGDGTGGDNIGTKQSYEIETHSHLMNFLVNSSGSGGTDLLSRPVNTGTTPTADEGGNETRPININVMFCIKY